ncbi:MAG: 2,3-diphosphoglycerate-dependent phosphoglycerate mutase [Bacteroidales bacterium]|jgi:2,3-bisphosphoglycerate-dependent phosphoglycerate mutase|nr:2,3-diphosphoglycerate-dependent phosphoglycerate mutase [Bacteroidales bacterium]
MLKLVLLRHGESVWNKENRFTGWTDVALSEKGIEEAKEAGRALKKEGFVPEVAYTSYLSRAIKTLWLALEEMNMTYLPVYKTWRLNEKHYGELQGLNKAETAKKFGDEQVLIWRRSFDVPPQPIAENDDRNAKFDPRYKNLLNKEIPRTESLKDTVERIVPYWQVEMAPMLKDKKHVLVAAHGNSLRGIVMYLKNMSQEDIISFNIPTGIPYVFEFDDDLHLQRDYFLGDPEVIKQLMEAVANQGKAK